MSAGFYYRGFITKRIVSQSSNLAVWDRFPGGDNMNMLFNCFESSNEEKMGG